MLRNYVQKYIRAKAKYLLDFFFPPSELTRILEQSSISELREILPKAYGLKEKSSVACFSYESKLVRELISEIKYKGNPYLTEKVAHFLHEEILALMEENDPISKDYRPIIMPIPISKAKLRSRGFNQCERLCRTLFKIDEGNTYDISLVLLQKPIETESQTSTKSKKERLLNVRNTFSVSRPEYIHGRDIIVIDDVITTGATIKEAKRVLKKSGARSVQAISIAH